MQSARYAWQIFSNFNVRISSKNMRIIDFHEILSGWCRPTHMTVIIAVLSCRNFANEPE